MEEHGKDSRSMILSIALVWFATHVGGGFASGTTMFAYFINYGIGCLVLPALSLAGIAFIYWWGWRHARIHETYDYRTFNDSFYGKYAPVMSNLYEVLIVFVIVIGASVAFATGSSLLTEIAHIPYWAATLVIAGVIFGVCIFGTSAVRRASVAFSALMIASLLAIYVPAIAMHADDIAASVGSMQAGFSPDMVLPGLWGMLLYAIYQASDVALYVQHMRPVKSVASIGKAMVLSYFINLAFFMLAILGLLTVAQSPDLPATTVPLLLVIDGLPYAGALKVAAGVLISLACISTAVTFISSIVKRLCVRIEGREATERAEDRGRPTKAGMAVAAAATLACCSISQFGLLALIQQGYSLLGYMAIPVVTIPYIANFIWVRCR